MQTIEAIIDEQGHIHWSEQILFKKAQRVLITLLPDEMFSSESPKSARQILEETGFIGFGEASPDFSENYKTELFDLSDKKYDNC